MKQKALIICLVAFFVSIMISCYTTYSYFDTKITSIEVSNAKYKNSYFKINASQSVLYDEYCLMIKCFLEDSLRYSERRSALKSFSFIHEAYCAYDPAHEFEYKLKDSIKSVNIYSLNDFNDLSKAGSNLIDYFKISYNVGYPMDNDDSIPGKGDLDNWRQIHELFSKGKIYSDNLTLFMTLKEKPKFEQQRFIVEFEYFSGKLMADTANAIILK